MPTTTPQQHPIESNNDDNVAGGGRGRCGLRRHRRHHHRLVAVTAGWFMAMMMLLTTSSWQSSSSSSSVQLFFAAACSPPFGTLYGPFFYPWPGAIDNRPALWSTSSDGSIALGTLTLFGDTTTNTTTTTSNSVEPTKINVTISVQDGTITSGWPSNVMPTVPPSPVVDPTGGYNLIVSTDGSNVTWIASGATSPDDGITLGLELPAPYYTTTTSVDRIFWFVDTTTMGENNDDILFEVAYVFYPGTVNCTLPAAQEMDDRCNEECVTCTFEDNFVSAIELATGEIISSGVPFDSSSGIFLFEPGLMNSLRTVWGGVGDDASLHIVNLGLMDSCGNSGHLRYYPEDGTVEEMMRFDPGYLYATAIDDDDPYVAYSIQQMEQAGDEQRYVVSFALQKFNMVTGEIISTTALDNDALWALSGLTQPPVVIDATTTPVPTVAGPPTPPTVPITIRVPTQSPTASVIAAEPSTSAPVLLGNATTTAPTIGGGGSTAPTIMPSSSTLNAATGTTIPTVTTKVVGNGTTTSSTTSGTAPSSAPSIFTIMSTTCSSNPACAALALADDCCPTMSGVFLQCCYTDRTVSLNCPANPRCAVEELDGACCPTVEGWYLDCCDVVPNDCGDDGNASTTTQCEVINVAEYKSRRAASAATALPPQWSLSIATAITMVLLSGWMFVV